MSLSVLVEAVPLREDETGTIRIGNTRVTLDTVITVFLNGATPEEIVQQYPAVELADIYHVLSYYLRHTDEVNQYLAEQQAIAAEVRRKIEARFDSTGTRERLLARKSP